MDSSMRFQAYKIAGSPSHKTSRKLVGCIDRRSPACPTGLLKKFLKQGFGEAPSYKATPQRIVISLNAHWYHNFFNSWLPAVSNGSQTGEKGGA